MSAHQEVTAQLPLAFIIASVFQYTINYISVIL